MGQRESIDFDVLIVGAGPAGLACAIHLMDLLEAHNREAAAAGGPELRPEVAVIEKGREVGAHSLSGAVLDPKALVELLPGFREEGAPLEAEVGEDQLLWLTRRGAVRIPLTPPPLRNHGNHIVSLNRLVRWLGERAEARGVQVFCGFPGDRLLMEEEGNVAGVVLKDGGVDRHGRPKSNHEPGAELRAKVTVLAEGSRGSLTKKLVDRLGLHNVHPQVYAVGVKEVWDVPAGRCPPGTVVHTMGYPLDSETFGGGWVYGMGPSDGGRNLVSVGLVVGLDYRDPTIDPHHEFQRYKLHPRIRARIEGGTLVGYGAKALPEGGLFSMPRPWGDGFLIVGDAGGWLNSMRLKGIHLAIRSGMLAARTVLEALKKQDFSGSVLSGFEGRFREDWSHRELAGARNFHQGFQKGRLFGLLNAAAATLTGGRGFPFRDRLPAAAGHEHMRRLSERFGPQGPPPRPRLPEGGALTFDKLTSVYSSGTKHEEDQPCHLVVTQPDLCVSRCTEEYGNPCQHFCPAAVYEMVAGDGEGLRLQINASNCVHCKTCDIMDPYQVIDWVTPEGGGGPYYKDL